MWSITLGGAQERVSYERACELYQNGRLKPDDLVFPPNAKKWYPASAYQTDLMASKSIKMLSVVMNGQQEQLTLARARDLFAAGTLKTDDLAFLDGGNKWVNISSVAQIVGADTAAAHQAGLNSHNISHNNMQTIAQKENVVQSLQKIPDPIQMQLVNPAASQLSEVNSGARVLYEASKLSVGTAYIFLIFLGIFGAHRFYMGRTGTALTLLCCTLLSMLLMLVLIGFITIYISAFWVFIDIFLISEIVRKHNYSLAVRLFPEQNILML